MSSGTYVMTMKRTRSSELEMFSMKTFFYKDLQMPIQKNMAENEEACDDDDVLQPIDQNVQPKEEEHQLFDVPV